MIIANIASLPAPIRIGVFLFALLIVWLPLAAPVYFLLDDPNLVTILTMGLMFAVFLWLLRFWGNQIYKTSLLKRYGLLSTRQNGLEWLKGLSIGLLFTLGLFLLEGLLGWVKLTFSVNIKIVAEGLLSAIGIALVEELVFRGWLLDELQQDYSPPVVLWADAVVFALLHFLKPVDEIIRTLITFPALVLLGLTLVWAKRSHRHRLGICIGLHAGLVWGWYIVNVGQLVHNSRQIPAWIIGIDGNPLAGVMGLLFLGGLAGWMRKASIT